MLAINYRDDDFVARARQVPGGRGVDEILDRIGARYLAEILAALAPGGHLAELGLMGDAWSWPSCWLSSPWFPPLRCSTTSSSTTTTRCTSPTTRWFKPGCPP